MSEKVENILLRHLIPDLSNLVSEYCWYSEDDDIEGICFHGNYEKILEHMGLLVNDSEYWDDGLSGACDAGHMKIIKLLMDRGKQSFNVLKNT